MLEVLTNRPKEYPSSFRTPFLRAPVRPGIMTLMGEKFLIKKGFKRDDSSWQKAISYKSMSRGGAPFLDF